MLLTPRKKGTCIIAAADRRGNDACPLFHQQRRGLSLLEVLIALAIFLMSLIVIGRLVTLGGDRALDVQQQGQAAQLCQSKLAEINAGVVPLSSQAEVPFDEDPDWYWSLEAEQGTVSGLWNVTVRVHRIRSDGSRVECSLHQMVLDPSLRGSTADAAAAASSSSSDTSGASTSGTSTGSSTSATAGGR